MRFALAEANWGDDDGTTSLAIVTPTDLDRPSEYGRAATGYQTAEIGYEFDSTYDPTVNDHPDPTPVVFYPNELRDIITEVRNTLPVDPFHPLTSMFSSTGLTTRRVEKDFSRRSVQTKKENGVSSSRCSETTAATPISKSSAAPTTLGSADRQPSVAKSSRASSETSPSSDTGISPPSD